MKQPMPPGFVPAAVDVECPQQCRCVIPINQLPIFDTGEIE